MVGMEGNGRMPPVARLLRHDRAEKDITDFSKPVMPLHAQEVGKVNRALHKRDDLPSLLLVSAFRFACSAAVAHAATHAGCGLSDPPRVQSRHWRPEMT